MNGRRRSGIAAARDASEVEVVGRPPAGVLPADVRRVLVSALDTLGRRGGTVSVRFASDRFVRGLNRRFRGVDRSTDVLSFPSGDEVEGGCFLGDLLLSRERVLVQAEAAGTSVRCEVEELLLHGLLHLLGHDHETDSGEMDTLELALRRKILDRGAVAMRTR